MPSTAFKAPGTATILTITGAGSTWASANNALTSNGQYAVHSVPSDSGLTAEETLAGHPLVERLLLSNFDFSSVPVGATINGISLKIKVFDNYGHDDLGFQIGARLYKNSGGTVFQEADEIGSEKVVGTTYNFSNSIDGYNAANMTTWWRAYAASPAGTYVIYADQGGSTGNQYSISQIFSGDYTTEPSLYPSVWPALVVDLHGTGGPESNTDEVNVLVNNDEIFSGEVTLYNTFVDAEQEFAPVQFANGQDIPDDVTETALGGASDIWGAVSIPRDTVVNSGFGVEIYYTDDYGFTDITYRLDYVEMQVHYTESSGGGVNLKPSGMCGGAWWLEY